jgi:hypothetical protein
MAFAVRKLAPLVLSKAFFCRTESAITQTGTGTGTNRSDPRNRVSEEKSSSAL